METKKMKKHENFIDAEVIKPGAWAGHVIGVFTSGGDAQGMNAAVRAIVRVGNYLGCKVLLYKRGYQGMVDGDEHIVHATWESTSNLIHVGGTSIGSARCMDFRERSGRLQAAKNLISHGITNLIAIGGDGSLTGANMFRQEWPGLLRELVDTGNVTQDKAMTCAHLNIVGLVGSIDNDFCGTDMTIGVDSALHRIIEAVDEITTTAVRQGGHVLMICKAVFVPNLPCQTKTLLTSITAFARTGEIACIQDLLNNFDLPKGRKYFYLCQFFNDDDHLPSATTDCHKRAFVLEVMGRMCGYLPLVAGISCEATTVFIPEDPPSGDWKTTLCEQIREGAKSHVRRTHMILVAEGAIDRYGYPIKASDVQKVLTDRMQMDVRVTVLGHVQRGGKASAFDRIIGTRMGAEAVVALMDATHDTPACVITLDGIDITRTPLMKAVETTKMVCQRMVERNFDEVVKLRGRSIRNNLFIFNMQHNVIPHPVFSKKVSKKLLRIAMIHNGEPACGMNAAARGFVGLCVSKGYEPLFIYESWHGLLHDKVEAVEWCQVDYFTSAGGSMLGTSSETAEAAGLCGIANKIYEHKISGLIIVGGFEAFQSAYELLMARRSYPELCIPINVIPATIANNVPGCKLSIGCDTAMNQVCKACDELKLAASSFQKCVYVVETGGEKCGYLTTLAALASGADACFINEVPFSVRDIHNTCKMLKDKLVNSGVKQGLVLRNERANENITTDFIYRIFNEEGKPYLTARKAILGHVQTGHTASPFDRCFGIKAGCRSAAWMILTMCQCNQQGSVYTDNPSTVTVTTSSSGKDCYTSVEQLALRADFSQRIQKDAWWLKLKDLLNILSWPVESDK